MPNFNAMRMTQLQGMLEPKLQAFISTKENKKELEVEEKQQKEEIIALLNEFDTDEIEVNKILVKLSTRQGSDRLNKNQTETVLKILKDKGFNPDNYVTKGKVSTVLTTNPITKLSL
jgi:peroxiredoxin